MKDLITRAKKGDKMAISELYSRTYKELLYYCDRLCRNDHDAEDLVQETYVTALEKLEQYRFDENFKGWLHTIALHKFYNKRRSLRPEIWAEDTADIPGNEELSCPEEYAEDRELYRLLSRIIADKLTEPQRITVVMFYYDEMSIARIAQLLECSQGTVKSRLYYARKLIRQELEKNGYMLGGSMFVISSALGVESAKFISETALNNKLLADLLGTKNIAKKAAASSVKHYAKGKILAGAAAVAMAGGAAAYHYAADKNQTAKPETEPPQITETQPAPSFTTTTTVERLPVTDSETQPLTGVSEPGGEPVEYDFVVSYFSASIPKNFQITSPAFGRDVVKEQEDGKIIALITPTPQRPIVLRPDKFSGDMIVLARSPSNEVFADPETALSKYFSDVKIGESSEITLTVDNTNAPELPTERTAQKISFTALSSGHTAAGIVVICKHRLNNYLFAFADCSGIRQEEYDAIIDSICFRYADNSWQDDYPHFNSGT